MPESKPRRKLAAILAADVVGFSKMMGENEDRTLRNLKACRSLTDDSIKENHGRVFGSAGDSIIAEFGSPVDAIVAAVEFQTNLKDRNNRVDPEDQMLFRVGLNMGAASLPFRRSGHLEMFLNIALHLSLAEVVSRGTKCKAM